MGFTLLSTILLGLLTQTAIGDPRRTTTARVVSASLPAVVQVTGTRLSGPGARTAYGTGILIHPDGYVLTASHVLRGVSSPTVRVTDHGSSPVEVVADEPRVDLALLRISGADDPLPFLKLQEKEDLSLGEPVIVIGHPYGYTHTVTRGILSGLRRDISFAEMHTEAPMADWIRDHFPGMLQTDAAINPGCSGGPLLNLLGEVIGVVSAMREGSENIGFAIPARTAHAFLRAARGE